VKCKSSLFSYLVILSKILDKNILCNTYYKDICLDSAETGITETGEPVSVGMNMYASEWSTLAELHHVSRFVLNVIVVYKVEFHPEHEFATI